MFRNPLELDSDLEEIVERTASYHRRLAFQVQESRERIERHENRGKHFSFSRLIEHMRDGSLAKSPEGDLLREIAEQFGKDFNPLRPVIPWALFARNLTAAQAAAGGYLVAAASVFAEDILRPWSVALSGGVTVLSNLVDDVGVSKTTGKATIEWQTTEATQATPSTPTQGQGVMTPKIGIGIVNLSRLIRRQANADQYVQRELLRTAATAVDTGLLNGSGVSGQPLGVLNHSEISTQSGSSLAYSGVLAMEKNAADADAQNIAFIADTETRKLLKGRERASGSGFIWEGARVADNPAYSTTVMPASTMLCGPMDRVTLGLWGGGITFEVNPFANFQSGGIAARVLVAMDVVITCAPSAFTKSSSIT